MTFNLDRNEISISYKIRGLRLKTNHGDNLLLSHVSIDDSKTIITDNYHSVKAHYHAFVRNEITEMDIEIISLKIVLYYFYMYQMWRGVYPAEKNRDLTFLNEDFGHPATGDQIIHYFKSKYPKNYIEQCEIMLQMSPEKFKTYYSNRQKFYNK